MNLSLKPFLKSAAVVAALAAAAVTPSAAVAAAFTSGNLVVSRVGDGSTLVNTGGPISILEFTPTGSLVQTIAIPSGNGGLIVSGTATSEAALSLSQDRQSVSLAGYIPPFSGTGSLSGRTDADAPRGYVTIGANGTVSAPVPIAAYSANNPRSAVVSNTGAYFAGGNTGTIYRAGSTNTTVQSTVTNTRVVKIIDNTLYFSTASGSSRGVWSFDTSLPTAAATASVLINQGGSPAEVYDFAINPAKTVAYLTNGSTLQRWTNSGSAWSLSHTSATVGSGLTGLAVFFGPTSDSLFAVNPSTLFGLSFDGSTFSSASTLASAGTNLAFRGLEVAPVPEPSTLALAGLGVALAGLAAWKRRRTRSAVLAA